MPNRNLEIMGSFEINTFEVSFYGYNDTLLTTVTVNYNENAKAPTVPEITGKTFVAWDKEFNNIVENTVIKAIYKVNQYNVTFLDRAGISVCSVS